MIGLGAGPHIVDALRESGVSLFFSGRAVTSLSELLARRVSVEEMVGPVVARFAEVFDLDVA